MRFAAGLAGMVGVVFGACSLPPPPATGWAWRYDASATDVPEFATAAGILTGFDAPRPDARLATGDAAVLGVRIRDHDDERIWFVRLVARERGAGQRNIPLRVTVYDASAREIDDVDIEVSSYLVRGVGSAFATGEARSRGTAVASVMDIVRVVEKTDSLASILWSIVNRPSLASLFGGVRIAGGISFDDAETTTWGEFPAWRFPFRVLVNREPGLFCSITAVEPSSPLRVCGGIVELAGADPEDEQRTILIRVLGARRGGAHDG